MKILGTGSYLPEKVYDNSYMESIVDTSDEWIVTRTGIRQRHIEEQSSVHMALEAARRALEDAQVAPETLGAVICATITPDNAVPCTACQVIYELGITCPAFDLSAACTGFLYAMKTAEAFVKEGRPVLVIGMDRLSKIVDYTDRSTCVLFGDGAGAAVLGVGEEIRYIGLHAYGDPKESLLVPAEDGPERKHCIYMDGQAVFKFATKELSRAAKEAMEALGLTAEDIDFVIPHQANLRIIDAAARRLKMPMEKFFVNVDTVGNTSAASIPVALDQASRAGRMKQGDTVLIVGFGGGLTSGAAIVTWSK